MRVVTLLDEHSRGCTLREDANQQSQGQSRELGPSKERAMRDMGVLCGVMDCESLTMCDPLDFSPGTQPTHAGLGFPSVLKNGTVGHGR